MRTYLSVFITFMAILFIACEPEEEQIDRSPEVRLVFSADSVVFDTLLTDRRSVTRRFRIFNPNDRAVRIDEIRLGLGRSSDYSIIVNGKPDDMINNEVLFGGDSLLVLVELTIEPKNEDLPYLVKDSVLISWNRQQTHVKLVAWGQDSRLVRSQLICDETWTEDRPYVIEEIAVVDSACTLTVLAGAEIYMDNGAALFIRGTLKVLGDSGNVVTIRNTRFDPDYLEAPGQWDAIYLLEGSHDNEIRFATIENGSIGLRVGTPDNDSRFDLVISETIIRHMSTAGILSFTSDVEAVNTLIHNTGNLLVGGYAGGNYSFKHCTFSNLPGFFISDEPPIQFSDNLVISEDETILSDLSVAFSNSILWGSTDETLLLSESGEREVTTELTNNIIRSNRSWPDNYHSNESNFPGFVDPFDFDYQLDSLAFARDKGTPIGIIKDIKGQRRDSRPDIGAYERFDP